MNAEHETQNDFPEHLDQWATLNFVAASKPQEAKPAHSDVAVLPPETSDNPQIAELEPLSFDGACLS